MKRAWGRYGDAILWLVVAHAVATAALRLVPAFHALLFVPDAPIDLLARHNEVLRWFDGEWIYGDAESSNYPPASYLLLWPLVGWMPDLGLRVLYAFSLAASLAVAGVLAVRASGADRAPEKAFLLVYLLPFGATQIIVWIGQLGLHVTAALMGAATILLGSRLDDPRRGAPLADVAAAALLSFSLVKPTLSVPLVVAVLILARRLRPAVLTAGMYVGLTLLAAAFQERSVIALVLDWLGREGVMNLPLGSANLYLWLDWIGYRGSMLPGSLLVLGAFVAWAWHYRSTAMLHVLGVSAIVARIWVHHRAFDDVVIVIVALVLFRLAKDAVRVSSRVSLTAAVLVAAIYLFGHAPYAYLSGESFILWLVAEAGRTAVWMASLGFLIWHGARRTLRSTELAAS